MNRLLLTYSFILTSQLCVATRINSPESAQFGFIENKGQIIDQNNNLNPSVLYLYNGAGLHVQLKQNAFSYEQIKIDRKPKTKTQNEAGVTGMFSEESFEYTFHSHRIDISFIGANTNTKITPYEPANDYINYYTTGTSEIGITNVNHYKKVVYQSIYPNIDIEFVLSEKKQNSAFKYNIIIHPGGNVNDIQLKFEGATQTSLTADGSVCMETIFGNIDESIPLTYQLDKKNVQQKITASFNMQNLRSDTYGITVVNYDTGQTLVIDPAPWATYYGGSGNDVGKGIALDASGNITITGYTTSTSSIATGGAHQTTYGGTYDAFVAKFNSYGVRQWATYYGGTGNDEAWNLAIDANGNILLSGVTSSTSGIVTPGAHQTTFGGVYDAFLVKFNTAGVRQWATYYGGSSDDYGRGVATDASGNVLLTGYTVSTSSIASSAAFQSVHGGGTYDAFAVKFNSLGVRQWATYYGGSHGDLGQGIAVDASGNVFITGATGSDSSITTTGAHQTAFGGTDDAFIVKFDPYGSRLWATYYGGTAGDHGNAIVTDATGNVFVSGYTYSTSAIATANAYQTSYNGGGYDAFIVKFNSSGTRQWATYYGGSGGDYGQGIAVDASGNVLVTGATSSISSIVTSGAYQTTLGGADDAFIVKFDSSGSRLWATYYGGTAAEVGNAMASDATGNIFVSGSTVSTSAIATANAYQTSYGGGSYDAFIAAFTSNGNLPVQLINFNAEEFNNSVNLYWYTASELNNDYFEIERSVNNTAWNTIGKVKGKGTSNSMNSYVFFDDIRMLAPKPCSSLFYRLRQTDFDGSVEYSNIAVVDLNQSNKVELLSVYPNPNEGTFTIAFTNLNSGKTIQLFDLTGKLIKSAQTENMELQINLDGYPKGIYFLKILTDQGIMNSKFVLE